MLNTVLNFLENMFSHKPEEQDTSLLTPSQREVYDMIRQSPGNTARELGAIYTPDDPGKPSRRVAELRDREFIYEGPHTYCTVTGFYVKTYFPVARR
jgi:hypothetical protein